LIQQRDEELINIGTGISSNFGDPFKDNK
jgi:hypothetical protein